MEKSKEQLKIKEFLYQAYIYYFAKIKWKIMHIRNIS